MYIYILYLELPSVGEILHTLQVHGTTRWVIICNMLEETTWWQVLQWNKEFVKNAIIVRTTHFYRVNAIFICVCRVGSRHFYRNRFSLFRYFESYNLKPTINIISVKLILPMNCPLHLVTFWRHVLTMHTFRMFFWNEARVREKTHTHIYMYIYTCMTDYC